MPVAGGAVHPVVIPQRLVDLGCHDILLLPSQQFLELFFSFLQLRCVRGLSRSPGSPKSVGQPELDPAHLIGIELQVPGPQICVVCTLEALSGLELLTRLVN